jgi:transcriptional regulator with XRE-family HTH domain
MKQDKFSSFIRDKRKESGLSLFDFGSEIGASWITIWRWEHEKCMPKPDAIRFWIDKVKSV